MRSAELLYRQDFHEKDFAEPSNLLEQTLFAKQVFDLLEATRPRAIVDAEFGAGDCPHGCDKKELNIGTKLLDPVIERMTKAVRGVHTTYFEVTCTVEWNALIMCNDFGESSTFSKFSFDEVKKLFDAVRGVSSDR